MYCSIKSFPVEANTLYIKGTITETISMITNQVHGNIDAFRKEHFASGLSKNEIRWISCTAFAACFKRKMNHPKIASLLSWISSSFNSKLSKYYKKKFMLVVSLDSDENAMLNKICY